MTHATQLRCLLSLAVFSACATPGYFTSPKLLKEGSLELSASAVMVNTAATQTSSGITQSGTEFIPIPAFHIRGSIYERLEMGAFIAANGVVGGNAKVGIIQSKYFDLAADLDVGGTWYEYFIHLPLVMGFNIDRFHLYLGARISWSAPFFVTWSTSNPALQARPPEGLVPGGLAAIRIDLPNGMWIQPGYDVMIETGAPAGDDRQFTYHFFSIAFGFLTIGDTTGS